MPFAPHEYIVKERCPLSVEEFEYFVNMQRENGITSLTDYELLIKLINTPLIEFNFAVKSIKILKGLGCKTIGEVACLQKDELMNVEHCGRKTVDDIEKVLEANGLSLATNFGNLLQVPIK